MKKTKKRTKKYIIPEAYAIITVDDEPYYELYYDSEIADGNSGPGDMVRRVKVTMELLPDEEDEET